MNKFPEGKQMTMTQRALVLEAVASIRGVRDLTRALGWKTSNVIRLLNTMNEERLVEFQTVSNSRRGRPKKIVACTPLGLEFLEAYQSLRMKPLRARKVDLERAVRDAVYIKRLVEFGHSPFKLFMELNAIVNNIKVSSKTSEII